jgi:DNA-directed RNA polymerase specialized sigma24 family protein
MSVANEVASHLPYLRRFARAVTGSQRSGDAYVASALEAIVADPEIFPEDLPARVALYHTFLKILNSVSLNEQGAKPGATAALDAADRHLDVLTPRARQAFLLVAVEDFSPTDAALVMDLPPAELQALIDQAGREIAQEMATSVVIIEDEPLIAMELEQLVSDLGHKVVQVARTRQQAIAAIERHRPGLVLADIQLADGSSGLDAINDVLKTFEVAVVFITAYPHRLLTGTRPEPTFLITKPFQAENVKAIISQALFFDTKARLAPAV